MESNLTVLSSLKELIEICRVKCSPLDEVILSNGRTNHEALLDAIKVAEETEENPAIRNDMKEAQQKWLKKETERWTKRLKQIEKKLRKLRSNQVTATQREEYLKTLFPPTVKDKSGELGNLKVLRSQFKHFPGTVDD